MKKSMFFILMVGVAIVFWGCSENNSTAPELSQSDQVATTLTKVKTAFTGASYFTTSLDAGTAKPLPNGKVLVQGVVREWYDNATDPRVAGQTIWYINAKINTDGSREMWGKGELNVDDNGGKWEMSWKGTMDIDGNIVDYVTGTGKEGDVKGMVGKWIYTSVKDITQPPGFYYYVEGYILE